jgi:muramoyltetrapeptide carboxypeptidase LdcA involved in peptidoglycan recycling
MEIHFAAAELRAHPKIHCGFSDLTVLSAVLLREGIPSFHGPMVAADLARNERHSSAAADSYDENSVYLRFTYTR